MSPSDPSEHPGTVTRTISGGPGPNAGDHENEQLRYEISRLRSRLDAADNDRAAADSDMSRLRQERRDLQDKLAETISALSQRRAELDDLRRQLDQTQSARDSLQHELNQVRIAEQVNLRVAERFEVQLQPLIQRLGDLTAQAARAELAHKAEINAREASLQIMVDRELALRARHKALGERLPPIEAQAAQRSHDIARISVLLAQAESERNAAQGEKHKHLAQIEALTRIQAELSAKVKTSETRAQQAERDSDSALTQLRVARKEQAENGEARITDLTARLASAKAGQEAAQQQVKDAVQARIEACEQLAQTETRLQGLVEANGELSLRTKADQDELRRVRQDSEARIADLTARLAEASAGQEAAQQQVKDAVQARIEACEQLAQTETRLQGLVEANGELSLRTKADQDELRRVRQDSETAQAALSRLQADLTQDSDSRIADLTARLAEASAGQDAAQNEAEEAIQARIEACEQLARLKAQMQGLVEADTRLSLRTKTDQDELRRVRQDSEAAQAALARLQADHASLSQSHDSILAQLHEATETVRAQTGIHRLLQQIAEAPTPWWQGAAARLRQRMDIVQASGLFDPEAYLQINPDVAEAGVDPLRHFVEYGLTEGRIARHPAGPDPVAAREPEQNR